MNQKFKLILFLLVTLKLSKKQEAMAKSSSITIEVGNVGITDIDPSVVAGNLKMALRELDLTSIDETSDINLSVLAKKLNVAFREEDQGWFSFIQVREPKEGTADAENQEHNWMNGKEAPGVSHGTVMNIRVTHKERRVEHETGGFVPLPGVLCVILGDCVVISVSGEDCNTLSPEAAAAVTEAKEEELTHMLDVDNKVDEDDFVLVTGVDGDDYVLL